MHTSTVTTDVPAPRTHDRASDELDRLTTDLALRVRAGALPEREARMAVFEAVFRTGIIPSETLRYCHRHDVARFLHDDMVEAAVDFYTRKLPRPPERRRRDRRLDGAQRHQVLRPRGVRRRRERGRLHPPGAR
ncbi:hypothetical protein [Cellulosimicrobium funkei]|uniref:hypothetical protein n=1 Tax=Cellulosimicrobium funkei TaxID=264251 RepID=UPI003429531B